MVLKLMRTDEVGRFSTSAHDVEVVKVPGGLTFRERVEVTAISGISAAIVNAAIRGGSYVIGRVNRGKSDAPKTEAESAA